MASRIFVTETRYVPIKLNEFPSGSRNPPKHYFQDTTKPGNLFYQLHEIDQPCLDLLVQRYIRTNRCVPSPGLFVDEANLRTFGVYDEVYQLLSSAGFRTPFLSKIPCYQPLVFEFYSTFMPNYGPFGGIDGWSFQIGGENFSYGKREICKWLDLPTQNNETLCYQGDSKIEMWNKISGEDWNFGYTIPADRIKDPVWKIIHALVARNFTSTIVLGSVIDEKELTILTAIDKGEVPNWFGLLTDLFMGRGEYHNYLLGGHFITKIATMLGFNFNLPQGVVDVLTLELADNVGDEESSNVPAGRKGTRRL